MCGGRVQDHVLAVGELAFWLAFCHAGEMARDDEILVNLDGVRRASLGRLGRPEHRRYLGTTAADGTITMRPVEVVPAVVGVKPATLEPAEVVERLRGNLERLSVEYDGGVIHRNVVEPAARESPPPGLCQAHGLHPHFGVQCPDCPECID